MQELSRRGEVMHIGCGGFHRVDDPGVLDHADVDFHAVGEAFRAAVVPLVTFLGLMHLGIPLPCLVLVPPARSAYSLGRVELGAAIKVASMIVPCFMAMPLALRCAFTASKI